MAENIRTDLAKQLDALVMSLEIHNQEATLSTLKRIYDNIIQHPNDDKYRQIKLTDKTFSNSVWLYPAAVELMKKSGWVVESNCVKLRDDSCIQIVAELLESVCKRNSHKWLLCKQPFSDCAARVITGLNDDQLGITQAIGSGDGKLLRKVLDKYDVSVIKEIKLGSNACVHIITAVLLFRQIGIARILAIEYGVDFNEVDGTGCPYYATLFEHAGDSSDSAQSLMIELIKELKLDVAAHYQRVPALHYAVLLKLDNVLKFLVEEYQVDINSVSVNLNRSTCLHVAYSMEQENIIKYLIEHGADQDVLDEDGRKPSDYRFREHNTAHNYSLLSQKFIMRAKALDITKNRGMSTIYYGELAAQNVPLIDALDRVFKEFPSLEGEISSYRDLDITPTLNELNCYIIDMAPFYYGIGLELDIVNSQMKLIRSDPSLPDLKEKCQRMLEVWLESDTCATWKKLCEALQEVGQDVLAERIAKA